MFYIGHSGSAKLMARWKGKELSPVLPKSGFLSLSYSASEPQAPPHTTEVIFTLHISQRPLGETTVMGS